MKYGSLNITNYKNWRGNLNKNGKFREEMQKQRPVDYGGKFQIAMQGERRRNVHSWQGHSRERGHRTSGETNRAALTVNRPFTACYELRSSGNIRQPYSFRRIRFSPSVFFNVSLSLYFLRLLSNINLNLKLKTCFNLHYFSTISFSFFCSIFPFFSLNNVIVI